MTNIDKSLAVLDFIRTFFGTEDRTPTLREIANHFNWASANAAQHQIRRLIAIGELEERPNGWRIARKEA